MSTDTLHELYTCDPFSLSRQKKTPMFINAIAQLNDYHYKHCSLYQKMIKKLGANLNSNNLSSFPFLPVPIFKQCELKSVPEKSLIKSMVSSGTSGQQPSKIFLDKETANRQSRALTHIVQSFIGKQRLPMLVIDSKSTYAGHSSFSARTAAIRGFSIFSKKMHFALDDRSNIDVDSLLNFCESYKNQSVILFGFTFLIYQYLIDFLERENISIDLSNAILIHGGGWKKLDKISISNQEFKRRLKNACKLDKVFNYYGMIEQTGSIFMECEHGYLHCSNYSDVIVRDQYLKECAVGEKGLIQLLSLLPESYPGHNLLSEDIGVITGEDNCMCGRKGKTFRVLGRSKHAELRGCSDVGKP